MSTNTQFTEELLGAELVAGKEIAQAAGTVMDAIERTSGIYRQQVDWMIRDHSSYWSTIFDNPTTPAQWPKAAAALVERRISHVGTGIDDWRNMLTQECTPLVKMWTDFFSVVKQDHQQR